MMKNHFIANRLRTYVFCWFVSYSQFIRSLQLRESQTMSLAGKRAEHFCVK